MTPSRVRVLIAGVVAAAWTAAPAAASQVPDPPARRAPEALVHGVRPGDTVWGIARLHSVRPEALSSANGLADPARLRIGARITITGSSARPSPDRDQPPARTPARNAAPDAIRFRRPAMDWPSRGVVTSRFGFRGKRHHHGIDIAAPVGSPITAARDGTVQFAGWQDGYGRLVILESGDGLTTWYGHALKILVAAGQRIAKGEVIALVGTSGEVTGPNVHFEVRRNNIPLDPWPYLTGPGK